MYKRFLSICIGIACLGSVCAQKVVSPNGKLSVEKQGDAYEVKFGDKKVVNISAVGVTTSGKENPTFQQMLKPKKVKADYQMLSGKRLHCTNRGNEAVFQYQYADGSPLRLVMRVYDDGIAFRYELSGLQDEKLKDEQTTFIIPEGTKRWIQQWSDGYEGFFPLTTTGSVKATGGFGGSQVLEKYNTHWGYPALIQPADDVYALISEANIERRQSASSLKNEGDASAYKVCPDVNEVALTGDWHTPWRVVIIGSLADVVESTLITDVSEPSKIEVTNWIKPGVVSWVYWAYNHGSNDLKIISKYVDMAQKMKLPYVLIDAEWDEFKNGATVEDAITYAKLLGVKPLIWYNSSVGWVDGAPGPKFRLNKPEDREKEFHWCDSVGIKGVKIDFFSGDNQMNMDYCIDLLESAAKHHLLVNFHGATIPRGWQRTYPNLLSTEGVYGAEWYNNVPTFTNKAAAHNATLPFTRNVIGPMDYTPCAFSDSQHPHITTHAHELALTVLFESGLQHLADRPESFLAQPNRVQKFLSDLPTVWDDTKFLGGYPGEYVVMARRKGLLWYVAMINGSDADRTISLDWSPLKLKRAKAKVFADSGNPTMPWDLSEIESLPSQIDLKPRGGCVMIIDTNMYPTSTVVVRGGGGGGGGRR
ncbi:MAG: glycoside hydrolase family 97 catalytic domain-containing protein [Bacteroidaceae bacterium]|nr:glycoside hydrolase family 97 catalytic domain-containing protein [Bacteroidaceae bacterium]